METLKAILQEKGNTVHKTGPNTTILEVARAMSEVHVGALLVCENDRPLGIVSERDIMKKVVGERRDPATTRVSDIMTKNVVCAGVDASQEQAMSIMTERRIRHLPVVLDGKVVGMVSIGDLVRAASREQTAEIQLLNDYLCGKYPG